MRIFVCVCDLSVSASVSVCRLCEFVSRCAFVASLIVMLVDTCTTIGRSCFWNFPCCVGAVCELFWRDGFIPCGFLLLLCSRGIAKRIIGGL